MPEGFYEDIYDGRVWKSFVDKLLHKKRTVSELQDLWNGIRTYTSESPSVKILVRGTLICAACDIPAARKVCGFKGHNANHGCSKCFKLFPGPITKKDYSGFRKIWPPRDIHAHRATSKKIKCARTVQARNDLEAIILLCPSWNTLILFCTLS